ncbi:MAG: FAD-binding protein [Saprospiraceae bacterium]|nr:FAD-binding protein [Saprospiraceae bacterium]
MDKKHNQIKGNWAGNVAFPHEQVAYPESEEAIVELVGHAHARKGKVRVVGSGHSFTALCQTRDTLISLDRYQGLLEVNHALCQATVKAGTKLHLLGDLLFAEGMAMENLGDIDVQSIAGTISTGTHGTGIAFGTISTQVVALRFVNGRGECISCSGIDQEELFKAAQVSLGAFGVITAVTLQCVPSYKLLVRNRKEPLDQVLSEIKLRNQTHRNFEYYWMPYTQTAWTKSTVVAHDGEPDQDRLIHTLSELLLENYAFKGLCELARHFPSLNKSVSRISAMSIPELDKRNHSHRVYATVRKVKFVEMEYNIPAAAYDEVIREVCKLVNSGRYAIHFPIENRWVKQDDIWMSPAYQRDSAYIACHVYHKKDHRAYFAALEEIFLAHEGRPHWGKMHALDVRRVSEAYPRFSSFDRMRRIHDPDDLFLSPYLQGLIG